MERLALGLVIWAGFVLVLPGYVAGLFARTYGWLVVIAWPPIYAYWDLRLTSGDETWSLAVAAAGLLGAVDEPVQFITAWLVLMVPTGLGFLGGIAVRGRVRRAS